MILTWDIVALVDGKKDLSCLGIERHDTTSNRKYWTKETPKKERYGAAARDHSKDSEQLRILITMTIWAIWKYGNKSSITGRSIERDKRGTERPPPVPVLVE